MPYVDKPLEGQSPLSAICSQRLLQLLYYLGLTEKSFGVAANILIVSGSEDLTKEKQAEAQKEELIRNLDFFREKARDFLIQTFVSVEQAAL